MIWNGITKHFDQSFVGSVKRFVHIGAKIDSSENGFASTSALDLRQ